MIINKRFHKYPKVLLGLFLICLFCSSGTSTDNPKRAIMWGRWEYKLTSSRENSGEHVNLDIVFTGPDGKTFKSHAFSDDNKTFTFRASFPESGTWKWKTTCSDPSIAGLHNKMGNVNVSKYEGANQLYIHGDLKVSDDRRYLMHADGTPFLWIGDTGWNATKKTTMAEWHYYVDTRANQGFSVIQISPRGVGDRALASEQKNISVTKDGTPDPFFWKDLEDKIAYANDKGILIMMAGVGNAWRDLMAENPGNQKFERYITGRLASHMVIFSPSFDQLFIDDLTKVAEELQKSTMHLVTQHPGTNYEANIRYRNSSVDFGGEQSGHHGGNLTKVYNAARQWTLDMWNGIPVKPVIDIEGMYDGYGNNNAKNWREKDVRKCGWIAWLSGSKGYTYGCGDIPPKVPKGNGGVWRFNKDSATYDFWKKAIDWTSAGQMTIMRDFFRAIDWWKLVPAHEMVMNQEADDTLKMVVSTTRERDLLLAYLPDNPVIKLDLRDFTRTLKGKWFNPVTGEYISIDHQVIPSSEVAFSRPEGWEDAILLLTESDNKE